MLKPSKSIWTMTFILRSIVLSLFIFGTIHSIGQVNKSAEENYRKRVEHIKYDYATQFDNGYVTLRDGTTLYGKISLVGKSYSQLSAVIIRTNGGKRYALRLRSLKEYGLINSLTNDTPDLFTWVQLNEPSAINAYQDIRTGTCGFGYVKLKDGATHEGELTVKEINGRIKSVTVKNDKGKNKFDDDQITNFGVKQYIDPKFVGVWSVIQWKKNMATGLLVNKKSIPAQGVVTLNDGTTSKGFIEIIKKEEITTQIRVSDTPDGKATKFKYDDVKSYTIEQRMSDYTAMLKNLDEPYAELHPSRNFHPGEIMLLDGTIIKGQVAKASDNDITDVFFAENETAIIKGYSAQEIDQIYQNIPQKTLDDYAALIYDRDHALDFPIQRPAQWKYQSQNEGDYVTEFQQGYIILTSGEEKVGALSVSKTGTLMKYTLMEGTEKVKYGMKEVVEYGLIENSPTTAFPAHLYRGMFMKKIPGFIRLLGSNDLIKGDLKIRTKDSGEEIMLIDDQKYNLESIEFYGLIDVPVKDLTRNGSLAYSDQKRMFHPGSFVLKGEKKEGFIAWAKPNGAGEYKAFFYAPTMDGVANVFYLKDGVTDVVQNIPQVIEEVTLISTEDAEQEYRGKGYILKKTGEKISGELQIVYPAGTWFSPEVALIESDSNITIFSKDESIKSVFVTIDGQEKEFLNYDGVFVEVLDRDGSLVHFRNPFPTMETLGGKMLNDLIQGKQEEFNQKEDEEAILAEREGRLDVHVTLTIAEIKIYVLENLIYDESSGRVTMYAPAPNFYSMMDAELCGCIEYLTMSFEDKYGLRRMKNPLETLKFINENMNN